MAARDRCGSGWEIRRILGGLHAFGGALGPAMLNIAVLAGKTPAVSNGTRTEA